MAVSVTTWLALVLFVCYAIWRWSRREFERKAERLPGPAKLPFIGNILEMGTNTTDVYKNTYRLGYNYSQLCRIWMGPKLYIAMVDPNDLEIIFGNPKYNTKAFIYKFLHPWLGTGLLTSTGEKWHKHRKIITPTFHFKILENFLQSFDKEADVLIDKLQKEVDGPAFDVYKYMTLYTLDTITETAMGLSINAQTDESSKYVAAVKRMADLFIHRSLSVWYYPDIIFNMSSLAALQNKTLEVLHGATNSMIRQKKEELKDSKNSITTEGGDSEFGIKKRVAFLDLLLQKNSEGLHITDENIREEVDTFMFEGHDTTSSALSFTMWLLSTHQDIQEKAYQEVNAFLSKEETLTLKTVNEMKYLECVIKESLRLYPSVPMLGREIFEDVKITRNLVLPANSSLLIPIFVVHRNPVYFPNPETFDPDRFLPDNACKLHPFSFLPFSAGSRNCIGQKFAMLEMKVAIAKIIKKYKLLPDPTYKPIPCIELIVKSANGIRLKLQRRDANET